MNDLTDDQLRNMAIAARNAWLDDWAQAEYEQAQADAEWQAEQRYERWLENGGAHADQIQWEAIEDECRSMPW